MNVRIINWRLILALGILVGGLLITFKADSISNGISNFLGKQYVIQIFMGATSSLVACFVYFKSKKVNRQKGRKKEEENY